MAFKFVAFAALLAVAQAGVISAPYAAAPVAYAAAPHAYAHPAAYAAAPIAKVAKTIVSDEYDPHPQYNYGYDIQDGLTGDSKNAHEQRDGDVVQGSYSLTDADGFRRTVDYTADPIHGFNAVVRREPLAVKAIAKVAAPVAYAAAPVAKIAAPVAYAAPAYHHAAAYAAPAYHQAAYAAPIAKVAAPAVAYAAPAHAYYHH